LARRGIAPIWLRILLLIAAILLIGAACDGLQLIGLAGSGDGWRLGGWVGASVFTRLYALGNLLGIADIGGALLAGGGYAQYAAVDARQALPIPGDLDFAHAAAIPETAFTVYVNMFEHGGLQAGETVLVHGGNSGIGVMAIQMAKAFGAKVIATARGAEKTEACILLGADQAIDATAEDFGALLKNSIDVILDIVGASYAASNMEALKPRGRLVYISMVGGNDVSLPIFTIMRKQLVITGSTLRPRTADEKARIAAQVEQRVWPWIAAAAIKSLVEQTFPLADAAKAHAWMDDSHVGKCVLTV
jgi:putative PIG3 family NAD(P)H quinone oxidoreductase